MAFARRARVRVRAESVCAHAQSVHATGKLHAWDAALSWGWRANERLECGGGVIFRIVLKYCDFK